MSPFPSAPALSRTGGWWLLAGAVLLLGGWIYGPVYGFGYLNLDDEQFIRDNPWLAMGFCARSLRWALLANLTEFSSSAEYWSPLTLLTRLADAWLYGGRAGGSHVTSALLHGVNTLLLGTALGVLTRERLRPALVALLFLVHPLQVEPVCWLSARKDLVNGCFFLLTLLAYGWYVRRPGRLRYALLLAAYAACLAAKPMGVSLPFLLLLLDLWPLRRWDSAPPALTAEKGRLLAEKLPLLLLAGLAAALAVQSQHDWGAMEGNTRFSLPVRVANALLSTVTYLRRLFWPSDLALYYPHPGPALSYGAAALAGVFLLAVTWELWRRRQRFPVGLVGWLWFGLVLGPVLGLVQIGGQAMADRYAYLAVIGPFLMLVWSLPLGRAHRWLIPAGAVALLALAAVSARQAGTWRNNQTVYTQALAVTGHNSTALLNLGCALMDTGRLREAEARLRQAVALSPQAALAWNDLARAQTLRGHEGEALASYGRALRLNPNHPQSLLFAGRLLRRHGDLRGAETVWQQLRAVAPELPQAPAELARLYTAEARWPAAAEAWAAVLALRPEEAEARAGLREAQAAAATTMSGAAAPYAASTSPPSPALPPPPATADPR